MKKLFLYSFLLAAGVLTSCSSEDTVNNGGQNGDAAPASYISVNIASTPEGGTRAADDKYEAGTEAENKVSKVRFYFFDKSGNAAAVKASSQANYYDWTSPDGSGTETTGPVERNLNAVLLIETKNGDGLPAQVVAVINPNETQLGTSSRNLAELRELTDDYAQSANASFVMCNSVYASPAKEEIAATKLTSENFQNSVESAKNKPVNVYVERNVAKVRVAFDTNVLNGNNRVKATTSDGTSIKVGGNEVYIQFDKWNITGDVNLANLSKHVDVNWSDVLGNNVAWNNAPYFRSYWASAVTPGTSETVQNLYANYTSNQAVEFTGTNFKYCNENAEKGTDTKNTQVIIPAKLCDADGNAYTIAEFAGQRYIANATTSDESDLTNLKKAILTYFENDHKHYYKDGSDYKEIALEDISFKTSTAASKNNANGTGSYYVYAVLSTTGETKTWYKHKLDGTYEECSTVGADLLAMPHAKIWKNGATYFYFDIKHLGTQVGVVRNHLYDTSLTAIYGLGTPVYDPNEKIIPEKPVEDDTYIAAQVKILSWRLIPSKMPLDWGK